jgi:hypothetical protein
MVVVVVTGEPPVWSKPCDGLGGCALQEVQCSIIPRPTSNARCSALTVPYAECYNNIKFGSTEQEVCTAFGEIEYQDMNDVDNSGAGIMIRFNYFPVKSHRRNDKGYTISPLKGYVLPRRCAKV